MWSKKGFEMPHTVGIGIIGMGWIGTVHSRCYRQVSDRYRDLGIQARMVICADEVKNRAQEAQERFGLLSYALSFVQKAIISIQFFDD